jgi:type II secretory pathway predicted ATPase ExeA
MYLSYYKLNKKPFQISTDPSFFWFGEKHKEALSILKYGVMDDKGFLLLTGDVGTGKTTLINAFINSLGDEVIISRVSDPGLTKLDFINYIAKMFKIETQFETKGEFLILFTQFLEQADKDDKKVLLIIDEAQHLTDDTLEEIRLLSNIENQDKKLLNIFLVGQSEFIETLEKHKNRALRQRLTLNLTLYPLEPEETKACIEYRLKVAGAVNQVFSPKAIDAIHAISNGFPRVINIICDHALRLGCQEDQEIISDTLIHKCSITLHAVHIPLSHQYESQLGSSDDWLEESEVSPLSPEAIDKASQPLPDFILNNDDEIRKKPGISRIVVPLLIATLLISGFFLLKDDHLESISKFITTLTTNPLPSISVQQAGVNNRPEIDKQSVALPPTKTISVDEISPSSPVVITKTTKKQTFKLTDSGDLIETDIHETNTERIDPEPLPTTTPEIVQENVQPYTREAIASTNIISSEKLDDENDEILIQKPVVSEINVTPVVVVKENPTEEAEEEIKTKSVEITEASQSQPELQDVGMDTVVEPEILAEPTYPSVTETPIATETKDRLDPETPPPQQKPQKINMDTVVEPGPTVANEIANTGSASTDNMSIDIDEKKTDSVQEKEKVEPERTAEPTNELVGKTPSSIDKEINNKKKTITQPEIELFPQKSNSTPAQSKIAPDPEEPEQTKAAALPSKTSPDIIDDPGAVIDWLLKAQ